MTLTAMIGALVALLPPFPPRPEPEQPSLDSEIERLTRENWRLARSHARLVDHIERLEREILTEQHICNHWKEEAERLARQSREARETRLSQEALALYQRPPNMRGQELLQAQQALQGQQRRQAFCNCVPSRSQVWGAADAAAEHLARPRP